MDAVVQAAAVEKSPQHRELGVAYVRAKVRTGGDPDDERLPPTLTLTLTQQCDAEHLPVLA